MREKTYSVSGENKEKGVERRKGEETILSIALSPLQYSMLECDI